MGIWEVEKNFHSDCLQAYRNAPDYLKRMLPINSFIENAAFINPEKRNASGSLEGISELTKMVLSVLLNVLSIIFPAVLTAEDVCDIVCTEWRLFQSQPIKQVQKRRFPQRNTVLIGKELSCWLGRFGIKGAVIFRILREEISNLVTNIVYCD